MKTNTILCGDALEMLRTLPDQCVQTCVTSPPYFGLRDYGTGQWTNGSDECDHETAIDECDHETAIQEHCHTNYTRSAGITGLQNQASAGRARLKSCPACGATRIDRQIGLEETPAEYISKLVAVFREVYRVLRDDGTLWVNMGDSYARGRLGRDDSGERGKFAGPRLETRERSTGLPDKNLLGMPWRLAFALQDQGWILRSEIIWHKPTAMPESVTDRPSKAHETIFLLAKRERYFYDADAIREPLKPKTYTTFGNHPTPNKGNDALGMVKSDNWNRTTQVRTPRLTADGIIAGANKRSVWTVASQPYPESHFATFPPKLIEPCILAGTSPIACEICSSPWSRITEATGHTNRREAAHAPFSNATKTDSTGWQPVRYGTDRWQPTCKCEQQGTGTCVVLDPFMGAGTVALVALQHHRHYIGIELNPAYVALAEKRIREVQPVLWTEGVAG